MLALKAHGRPKDRFAFTATCAAKPLFPLTHKLFLHFVSANDITSLDFNVRNRDENADWICKDFDS